MAAILVTEEFTVNIGQPDAMGQLCITDARMLIRPAQPGQLHRSVAHDTMYADTLLTHGNDGTGRDQWHILSDLDPEAAHKLLDRMFYAYVDGCCYSRWCDARVVYIVNGETVMVKEYGFVDGQYTMVFNVYCNVTNAEALITELQNALTDDDALIVARPIAAEPGYELKGYAPVQVESDEDDDLADVDYDDLYDDGDEDPLAGDIDDGSGYVPGPSPLTTQHYHALHQRGLL